MASQRVNLSKQSQCVTFSGVLFSRLQVNLAISLAKDCVTTNCLSLGTPVMETTKCCLLSPLAHLQHLVDRDARLGSFRSFKGEVRTINDRNICGRSCMKNKGKSPSFKFVSGAERRSSEVQRVSRGWRPLTPRTRQRIPLGSENDWKFRLRSCQS